MLVEPLADVDENVPGVMATLAAPETVQLRVLLVPELTLVGFAVKDAIAGAEAPEDEFDEVVEPQAASPTQADTINTSVHRSSSGDLRPRLPNLFLHNELVESIRTPFTALGYFTLGDDSLLPTA